VLPLQDYRWAGAERLLVRIWCDRFSFAPPFASDSLSLAHWQASVLLKDMFFEKIDSAYEE